MTGIKIRRKKTNGHIPYEDHCLFEGQMRQTCACNIHTHLSNKILTSVTIFLHSFTSLLAADGDDGDSVRCPGLQTVESCPSSALFGAIYKRGAMFKHDLVHCHESRRRSIPSDCHRTETDRYVQVPRYFRL